MKIKLIIFDLDGTLVDSSGDITNALNYAAEPYGFEKLTIERTVSLIGEGVSRLIEKRLGTKAADLQEAVLRRFLEYYGEHLVDSSTLYPGVRETLGLLGKYRKAVISNKREDLSKRLLEGLNSSIFFEVIWGSDSAPEKKPSPVPVLKMLEKMCCRPEEAVFVGDSVYDIQAGKAAGVRTVAVSYGYGNRRVLGGADVMIDRINDLLPIMDSFQ
jgi:phosphoglycolate phosphatase